MFDTVLKLKAMLNPRNTQFLSAVLDIILNHPKASPVVWEAFAKRFANTDIVAEAKEKLATIKRMVDEYRGKK